MFNHQRAIKIVAFSHKVHQPFDNVTGNPTGKRVYDLLRIVKMVDKTSLKFYSAIKDNEVLNSVILSILPRRRDGDDERTDWMGNNLTIKLENSKVIDINQLKSFSPLPSNPESINFVEYEEIGLSYDSITLEYGDLTIRDNWTANN